MLEFCCCGDRLDTRESMPGGGNVECCSVWLGCLRRERCVENRLRRTDEPSVSTLGVGDVSVRGTAMSISVEASLREAEE